MNLYRLSLEAYCAFLNCSGLLGNRLAAAYVAVNGEVSPEHLKEAEENGLLNNQKLTEEGQKLANIITLPEKTIIATNSSFGLVPLCVFSYKDDFWSLIKIDYSGKYVTLLGPIESENIVSIVKDALVGEQKVENFSPFSLILNNDEIIIVNCLIMLIGERLREKNKPLLPHNYRFNLEDLFLNKDFAKIALAEEVTSKSSETIDFFKDSKRLKEAIYSLIKKQVIVKSSVVDFWEPSLVFFNFLAPQSNMFILSYNDLASRIGHKYYVFPNSIIEINSYRNSITFTSVEDFDYSLWEK